MTPKPPKPPKDMETHNNLLLIRCMKNMGRDIWYKTSIDESDLALWKTISVKTRLKLTFIQEQWMILLHQYITENKDEVKNLFGETEFLKKYGESMSFLESDVECWTKLLSGQDAKTENSKNDERKDDSIAGTSTVSQSDIVEMAHDESNNFTKSSSSKHDKKELKRKLWHDTTFKEIVEAKYLKIDANDEQESKISKIQSIDHDKDTHDSFKSTTTMSLPADLPKMEYVRFGKTGLKVSKICLGCMSYGSPDWSPWINGEEESIEQIKLAYQAGINFFDTADVYSSGLSEIILGKALKEIGAHRGRVVIATKCFFPVYDAPKAHQATPNFAEDPDLVNRVGLSRKHIFDAVEGSLKRLGVDYIDLYQIHRLDTGTPMEEIMEALNDLVRSGKVRYIGASAMTAWQFQKLNNIAERRGWTKFVSMQNLYNLLFREEEREMIPYCLDAGIAGIPYSPLASGIITGKDRRTTRSGTTQLMTTIYPNTKQDSNEVIVAHVEDIAKKYGATNAQIALAWHFTKPYSTSPIIGVSKIEQLYDLLGALKIKLTEEDVKHLEEPYSPRPPQTLNF